MISLVRARLADWSGLIRAVEEALRLGVGDAATVLHILRRRDAEGRRRYAVHFCRNELMSWCESHRVDFVLGMARNQRLRKIIGAEMHAATQQWSEMSKPA